MPISARKRPWYLTRLNGPRASIAVTFDLYGHLMPGSEAEGAALLDAYLNGRPGDIEAAES